METDRQSKLRELTEVDRLIHEPARMAIMAVLFGAESAVFKSLLNMTRLTKVHLSRHASRLEEPGYVAMEKRFRGKIPYTEYSLTEKGREAFEAYRAGLKRMLKTLGE